MRGRLRPCSGLARSAGMAGFEEDAACLMVRRGTPEGSRAVEFAAVACEKSRYDARTSGHCPAF